MISYDPSASALLVGTRPLPPSYSQQETLTVVDEGSTSPEIIYDAHVMRSTEATIDTGGVISSSLDFGSTYQSQNTSIATVSNLGVVTRVADGVARISCYSGPDIQLVKVPVNRQVGANTDVFDSWVSGSLANAATNVIGSLIEGLTPSSSTLNIFSSANHTAGAYVRNTSLWCASFASKLTACSVWNSRTGSQFGCTLITPRHFATCNHGNPVQVGDTVRWVSDTNVTYNQTVQAVYNIPGTDSRIGLLNSALPSGVTPVKVLQSNIRDYLVELRFGVPCILRNQFGEAHISDLMSLTDDYSGFAVTPYGSRASWYRLLVAGDSGGSALLPIGADDLAIVSTWLTAGAGPAYHSRNWSSVIAALDASAGISTGYTPAVADLSTFTNFFV